MKRSSVRLLAGVAAIALCFAANEASAQRGGGHGGFGGGGGMRAGGGGFGGGGMGMRAGGFGGGMSGMRPGGIGWGGSRPGVGWGRGRPYWGGYNNWNNNNWWYGGLIAAPLIGALASSAYSYPYDDYYDDPYYRPYYTSSGYPAYSYRYGTSYYRPRVVVRHVRVVRRGYGHYRRPIVRARYGGPVVAHRIVVTRASVRR